jgi:hypothetical protein
MTSVIEGQKICNGPAPKAGIGKIVKFAPLFFVDMDAKNFCGFFFTCQGIWIENFFCPPPRPPTFYGKK